ncbi:hypothetical protein [Streptomyces sp. NPDC058424]|uniref:hypothetical protein n=1 Tax=Streptomyces sp. NPDC058424 TaxID=3346491 RepID=UPI00364E30A7
MSRAWGALTPSKTFAIPSAIRRPTSSVLGLLEESGVPYAVAVNQFDDYVSRYVRTAEHLDQALAALARMTGYFSAELPVRHFLTAFPDETMKAVGAWTRDEDLRVRRLASEATRPLLPWAPQIQLPVDAALPVLDQLYTDAHLYVRTSVANHLSDIAASQPDLAQRCAGRGAPRALRPVLSPQLPHRGGA